MSSSSQARTKLRPCRSRASCGMDLDDRRGRFGPVARLVVHRDVMCHHGPRGVRRRPQPGRGERLQPLERLPLGEIRSSFEVRRRERHEHARRMRGATRAARARRARRPRRRPPRPTTGPRPRHRAKTSEARSRAYPTAPTPSARPATGDTASADRCPPRRRASPPRGRAPRARCVPRRPPRPSAPPHPAESATAGGK
jgi:hypothetical protein